MTEYRTVENHPIIVGECYQTRDGRKAFVADISVGGVIVSIAGNSHNGYEFKSGFRPYPDSQGRTDLMRPYPSKKIEVTDKMIDAALVAYKAYEPCATFFPKARRMEAALEAVFAMIEPKVYTAEEAVAGKMALNAIRQKEDKEASQAYNKLYSKMIEDMSLNPKPLVFVDNDGWILWRGGECPVTPETKVIVKYRDEVRTSPVKASEIPWDSYHPACVPAAYRIIQEPKEERLYSPSNPPPESYLKQKGKIPTFFRYYADHDMDLAESISQYLYKYMKEKD